MKLIIDISEELYAKVPYLINKGSVLIGDVLEAVENGTQMEAQPSDEKNYLKRREKDYVSYNIEWLLKHWEQELDLLSGGKIKACEDTVSREAVIILVDRASEEHPYKVVGDSETYSNYNQGWSDACDWLYANIESVPSVTPQIESSEDCISREAVVNKIHALQDELVSNDDSKWNRNKLAFKYMAYVNRIILSEPSAIPQRPKGKWIEKTVNDSEDEGQEAIEVWQSAKCNKCKKYHTTPYMYYFDNFNYCPNCGCYMGGDADDD